jgi:hypothetical protein
LMQGSEAKPRGSATCDTADCTLLACGPCRFPAPAVLRGRRAGHATWHHKPEKRGSGHSAFSTAHLQCWLRQSSTGSVTRLQQVMLRCCSAVHPGSTARSPALLTLEQRGMLRSSMWPCQGLLLSPSRAAHHRPGAGTARASGAAPVGLQSAASLGNPERISGVQRFCMSRTSSSGEKLTRLSGDAHQILGLPFRFRSQSPRLPLLVGNQKL